MATPLGHFLAGAGVAALCRADDRPWRPLLVGGIAGMAPDLDFIPGLLIGDPARFHHEMTHTLLFALLAGVVAALFASHARGRWAMLAGLAYGTHLLLDFFTLDTSYPFGFPVFWPVSSETYVSPLALLPNVQHSTDPALSMHNLGVAARELLVLGPLALLAVWYARRPASRSGPDNQR